MAEHLEGGCLCGSVRYRIDGRHGDAAICHCTSCRRAAGAQSVAWLTVPVASFRFVSGESVRHASSPEVQRCHCGRCGTSLTYQADADSLDVTIGSLDAPEAVRPEREIWLSHRVAWEPLDRALEHYQQGRTAPD